MLFWLPVTRLRPPLLCSDFSFLTFVNSHVFPTFRSKVLLAKVWTTFRLKMFGAEPTPTAFPVRPPPRGWMDCQIHFGPGLACRTLSWYPSLPSILPVPHVVFSTLKHCTKTLMFPCQRGCFSDAWTRAKERTMTHLVPGYSFKDGGGERGGGELHCFNTDHHVPK